MDRSRYKCPEIMDFLEFQCVFATPGAKMLPRINPIALGNGLRAAELKYDLVCGVGYGKFQNCP